MIILVPIPNIHNDYKGTPTPTLEQYMTTRMKTEIFSIKREIWQSWRQNSQLLREAENTELRAQIFFDDLFDQTEIFLNQTLPQHCDKFKHFVENARTPPGKIESSPSGSDGHCDQVFEVPALFMDHGTKLG